MEEKLQQLLSSTDEATIELGILIAEANNMDIGLEDYKAVYLARYSNRTRGYYSGKNIEKQSTVHIIKHVNDFKNIKLQLEPFGDQLAALLKLQNLEDLEVYFSKSGFQFNQCAARYIYQLTRLKSLTIHDYNLPFLNASIGNLVHLERLDIQYNKIKTLPPEIQQLQKLKELYLRGNPILKSKVAMQQLKAWLPHCEISQKSPKKT